MKKLFAPDMYGNQPCSYMLASEAQKKAVCNGCGSKGMDKKWVNLLDHLCGVDLLPACNIHDWMYQYGVSEEDKVYADEVFHGNMNKIVDAGSWFLKYPRRLIVDEYWLAVKAFGDSAFWANKLKEI